MKLFLVTLLLSVFAIALAANGRGFNDSINWFNNLEDAQQEAKTQNKPLMILIHKTWCGACTRLKTSFASDDVKSVIKQSENFIMVNLENDEEPKDKSYAPDGGYIPRIVFADSNGTVRPDVKDDARQKYAYFYSDAKSVTKAMQKALEKLN